MNSSAKTRSRRGTSGQEDNTFKEVDQTLNHQESLEKLTTPESSDSDAQAVEDSGSSEVAPMPGEDLKLAIKMNKYISKALGLDLKRRSVVL